MSSSRSHYSSSVILSEAKACPERKPKGTYAPRRWFKICPQPLWRQLAAESPHHLQTQSATSHPARGGTTSSAAWRSCDGPAARRSGRHQRSTPLATIAPSAYNPVMPAAQPHLRISLAVAASPPPARQQTSLRPGD